jgi:hypothetical protein
MFLAFKVSPPKTFSRRYPSTELSPLVRGLWDFPFRGLFLGFSQVIRLFEFVDGRVTDARRVHSLHVVYQIF